MSQDNTPKTIPEGILELLESSIASMMKESKIPGMSLAVLSGEDLLYAKGFGARNLEMNVPATPNTLYGFGSCTKSYTALAIMQLYEQGKLDLYDPVNKYFNFKLGNKKNPITIHHLLTHSSGIPNLGTAEILLGRNAGYKEFHIPLSSWDDYLTFINDAKQEVAAEPGQRFAYSNESYTMLGAIIEKVSNMKYENYVREHILNPLKMKRSCFLRDEFEKDSDIMTAYFPKFENGNIIQIEPASHPFDKYIFAPGGLLSSVIEQINYIEMNINQGIFEGTRIINGNLIQKMHTNYIETDMIRDAIGEFEKVGYGYGWIIIEDFFEHTTIFHVGGTNVSTSFIGFIPEKKFGIACACNSGGGYSLISAIPLLTMVFLLGKNPLKDIKFIEIEQKLTMLQGFYETYKGINKLSVIKRGAMLYIEPLEESAPFNNGMSAPLIPESLDEFKFYFLSGLGGRTSVEFEVGSAGKIDLYIERNRFHKIKDL